MLSGPPRRYAGKARRHRSWILLCSFSSSSPSLSVIVYIYGLDTIWACDPKCLLQRPETSKLLKVVRRGCKRCFGQMEKGSPKSLLHYCNPGFAPVQPSFAPVQQAFDPHTPKHLLHPLLTTLGNFEVSCLCSRRLGSQMWAPLSVQSTTASTFFAPLAMHTGVCDRLE